MSHGWYVPAATPTSPEQRILEQSVRLPHGGAVTGWAALRLHRAGFFDGLAADRRTLLPVPLALGPRGRVRVDRQVALSYERLEPEEIVRRAGIRCTAVERALFDAMRQSGDVREATVALDMAAAAFLTSLARMRAYLGDHASWRRAAVARRALELASEDSRSPNETRLRLIYQLDADLPAPLVNQPVWDVHGNLLGIADLLDPIAGLVGEFDGAEHRSAGRHMHDIGRQEKFERCGLVVFRVTGLDLPRPREVVDRIHFHRSRALWLPADRRAWTLDPPDGWPVEQTVDEYLAEREALLDQLRVGA